MVREHLNRLIEWKNSKIRKPLIVRGARQVGKTWLLKEFGKQEFDQLIYINFEDNPHLKNLFSNDFNIKRIITSLEIFSQTTISSDNCLIVFDEIQEADRGLTSLKYFCENAPEYYIAAAGSLLGIAYHKQESFPVGKVDFLDMHPMSFTEFLLALNEQKLVEVLVQKEWATLQIFNNRLTELLRYYFFIGGMPEVVQTFVETNDFEKVRVIQKRILLSYEADFSKHAPHNLVPRIRMVWQSIVPQLAKENKKFIFGLLREGARARDFEVALQWLTDAGLLIKCNRISKPELPLTAFMDYTAFKLFLHDVGLLLTMAGIDSKSIIEGNKLFTQFNGAIAEQFVIQELTIQPDIINSYWTNDRNSAEVDFVIQTDGKIIPIEVKSGENLRSKSFKLFCEKYHSVTAIRLSLADYKEETWMTNIPLWAAGVI
jgi:hypothetical protein